MLNGMAEHIRIGSLQSLLLGEPKFLLRGIAAMLLYAGEIHDGLVERGDSSFRRTDLAMVRVMNKPTLLFNDECAVCRLIAHWVRVSAGREIGGSSIIVRAIGNDPDILRSLNPKLDIWEA